jgi:hypothetical protein
MILSDDTALIGGPKVIVLMCCLALLAPLGLWMLP